MKFFKTTNWISNHQGISGFATLVGTVLGLVAALRSQDIWIQASGIFLAFFAVLILFYICLPRIVSICKWLSWKFVFGFIIGAIVSIFLYPFIATGIWHMSSSQDMIEVTHTDPHMGSTLDRPSDSIDVYFSKSLTDSERSKIYLTIEPDYPIKWVWIIDYSQEIHQLSVEPTKYYPKEHTPRFEYAKKYTLKISGRSLKSKVSAVFHTPQKERD